MKKYLYNKYEESHKSLKTTMFFLTRSLECDVSNMIIDTLILIILASSFATLQEEALKIVVGNVHDIANSLQRTREKIVYNAS